MLYSISQHILVCQQVFVYQKKSFFSLGQTFPCTQDGLQRRAQSAALASPKTRKKLWRKETSSQKNRSFFFASFFLCLHHGTCISLSVVFLPKPSCSYSIPKRNHRGAIFLSRKYKKRNLEEFKDPKPQPSKDPRIPWGFNVEWSRKQLTNELQTFNSRFFSPSFGPLL